MRGIINIIAYLYGREAAEKLQQHVVEIERNKDGRIRRVYIDGKLAFVLRNNDGYLLPTIHGAMFLERKAVVDSEAAKYVAMGRNVPAKYIISITPDVRANGEVAVVDPSGSIIAVGRLIYSIKELTLKRGYAIRVRETLEKTTQQPPPP